MANSTLTNPIAEAREGSPLPEASRFVCQPGCGLCCSYRVLVTDRDVQRLGASTSSPKPWHGGGDGQPALFRTPDFCLFLDPKRRCSVYEHRPEHCRTYPYLTTRYDAVELDVDLSCPGLGNGEKIPAQQLKASAESSEDQSLRAKALQQVRELLVAQRRYASRGWLFAVGRGQVDELATTWYDVAPAGAWTRRVEQRRPVLVNVETEAALVKLRQGLVSSRLSTRGLLEDATLLEQHFARPRWNTRLHPSGKLDVYRFWIAGGALHVEETGGPRSVTSLSAVGHIPWEPEALVTREAYLRRWLGRQLLLRLATNLTVEALIAGGHLAVTYLKLLLEIDHRLAILAPALAQAGGRDTVDRPLALEAVRGSDGVLRAWCESARVGTAN